MIGAAIVIAATAFIAAIVIHVVALVRYLSVGGTHGRREVLAALITGFMQKDITSVLGEDGITPSALDRALKMGQILCDVILIGSMLVALVGALGS